MGKCCRYQNLRGRKLQIVAFLVLLMIYPYGVWNSCKLLPVLESSWYDHRMVFITTPPPPCKPKNEDLSIKCTHPKKKPRQNLEDNVKKDVMVTVLSVLFSVYRIMFILWGVFTVYLVCPFKILVYPFKILVYIACKVDVFIGLRYLQGPRPVSRDNTNISWKSWM